MDTDSREVGPTAAFETEDDDPEAPLRRRERREALKQAAREEEEDESLLDESDADENDGQPGEAAATAEMLQDPRDGAEQPAPQPAQAAPPLPPPTQAADATPPMEDDIGTGKDNMNSKKNPIRQKVELKFVNCGSKANPSSAGEQLRFNPANLIGAGQAKTNPRGGSGLLGHSDSASSSYFSVAALKKSSLTNPNIMQGGRAERETCQIGSFDSRGDGRIALCHIRSVIEKKQNISTSFSPKTLMCSSCPARGEHPAFGEGGNCQCFILSDQNFPGCVPVTAGECLKIIRIENGMLGELVG